ncbi:MAG: ATP-binding cassette domain-containing protein [Bacteroidetes bacterium]|nr:MAG: ATP-binding cassette domain-containing protein [Bacteroidota bacterium]
MGKTVVKYSNVEIGLNSDFKIRELSLTVNKGEFVYLIGKTGSGKSSILKSMYAEKKIITGKAYISKTNLTTIKDREIPLLRRKIGIIFQDFQLLKDRTVYKNLEFVLKATGWTNSMSINEQIKSCLDKVHISELSEKYPSQLSGGQKQKAAIARALLNNPEIIIADEPTGNLDPKSSIEIMNVLTEINQNGNTILMATHDFLLLKQYKGRILRCNEGMIDEIESKDLNIETVYV